jgi:hypothetical protein
MEEQQKKEIHTAWEISSLIDRLTDLLWDRYEDSFLEIYSQEEDEKFLRTICPPRGEETDPSG